MKKLEDKKAIVEILVEKLKANGNFYITDIADLNSAQTSELRRKCFNKDIELLAVKNSLLRKALEQIGGNFDEIYPVLKGGSSIMLSTNPNIAAKLIKEIRGVGNEKPLLKAAYVEESLYIGDNEIDTLVKLKSKNELIGDIVFLLQSPIQNVIGALNSGKNIIGGVVKTLSERNN